MKGARERMSTGIVWSLLLSAMVVGLGVVPAAAAADPGLAEKLKGFKGKISYEYDWRINEP
jgi:hypothetical protein